MRTGHARKVPGGTEYSPMGCGILFNIGLSLSKIVASSSWDRITLFARHMSARLRLDEVTLTHSRHSAGARQSLGGRTDLALWHHLERHRTSVAALSSVTFIVPHLDIFVMLY